MTIQPILIDDIRAQSRKLVRTLGFMGGAFAGTDLPPSSVHALIEVGQQPGITAAALCDLLRLDKSSVSRLLRKLVLSGDLRETPDAADQRVKRLTLTQKGSERVAAIHAFARSQVAGALDRLQPERHQTVLDGLQLYAQALAPETGAAAAPVEIVTGYHSGLIAGITQMHIDYYARTAGFGRAFEAVVAGGLADFCNRLNHPGNQVWTVTRAGRILGSIAIDGEDLGHDPDKSRTEGRGPSIAHLRWFILDDSLRGAGLGRRLMAKALAFVDAQGFARTDLWTFDGLAAARHLYESHGFALAEQRPGDQWGIEVLEQRFTRQRPEPLSTERA
ncbi:MarR family transcriptional regulator [Rhizobium sp. Root274]|uniref:bifunctional helix-turn-helix transcriptional regulator/GNAT family N-acetyltransferase n=1 Tax=unclassified Rhizobium TaxID=2613769 RepID=UPI0007126F54|nr:MULTISPECIES: helix-turn-helix domain-containing GNAT family N-acetyltransferase [unclassified Rhizobium]KQW31269.1 MarR family transcriptional regulator [Rhizobium sp. Root1240]KRD32815.1 MarR family transcriptional regulator [Rhizobium sp. Root274]